MSERTRRIQALGVAGAPAPGHLTTTFRLAPGVYLDTGALAHGIPPGQRRDVATILLSHSHLDHTLGLPFLLADAQPHVIGLAETLDAVRGNLLGGCIWPDLSHRARWEAIREGERVTLGPWEVEAGPARHAVPCLSYALRDGGRTLLLIGDTAPDEEVIGWAASCAPDACVVEASFPNALEELARLSGHQVPRDLIAWREALGSQCELLVTHLKPVHQMAVRAECAKLGDPLLRVLGDGDVIEV